MTINEKNVTRITLAKLNEENQQLKADNQILGKELTYFKEYAADLEEEVNHLKARCRQLSIENHDLLLENKDMNFTRKFLGTPMSEADLAEDKCIADGEVCYERFAFIGDDY